MSTARVEAIRLIRRWPVSRIASMCISCLFACGEGSVQAISRECGDIEVDGNVLTPYGLEIVDCKLAEDVASEFARSGNVLLLTGACVLRGRGSDAYFECWDRGGFGVPGSVGEGGVPLRDDEGRIPGIIVGGGPLNKQNYQSLLLRHGAANIASYCGVEDVGTQDYCGILISSPQAKVGN
ncbi:hypothetical protein ACNOYE_26850 [Nannocystaceae bacterium ST9]